MDSGATSHFFCVDSPVDNVQEATNPLQVTIPNGAQVRSTHTCTSQLPGIPEKGRFGHILPGLARHSLISVVHLCNAGCKVTFTKTECIVKYRGREVLRGQKCTRTGLWMVHLNPAEETVTETRNPEEEEAQQITLEYGKSHVWEFAASVIQEYAANIIPTSSKAELAMYYHQCFGSPPKSTMLKAIQNRQLRSFPGLDYELISKYLPPSTATAKGHMVRTRQGARSTHSNRQEIVDARLEVDDMNPPEHICTAMEDEMFIFAVLADEIDGTIYSDQTGRFPVRSFSGKNYIFVAYIYKTNYILL